MVAPEDHEAMMKVNRKVEYALIGLKHMNHLRPGQLATAKEISETFHCPFDVVSRVLQIMSHNGLLRSEKGTNGGYQLIRYLSRVSFLELLDMILGQVNVVQCLTPGKGDCGLQSTCNLKSPMSILNDKLIGFLGQMSVLELIEGNGLTHRGGVMASTGNVINTPEEYE